VSGDNKSCIFCGAVGKLTGEHIWGGWTSKYVPSPTNKHNFHSVVAATPTEEKSEPVRIVPGDPLNSKVKVVCKPCNNGWLSQIQEKAKPYLIPLFDGQNATLGKEAQRWIATWAAMATMTGEYLSRDEQNVAVPQKERTRFMQARRPPNNWRIWIGKYEREKWAGQWRHNSFPIYPEKEIMQAAASGKRLPNHQTTSFVIGKLFVHVFSGHFRGIIMRWDWQNASAGSYVVVAWTGANEGFADPSTQASAQHRVGRNHYCFGHHIGTYNLLSSSRAAIVVRHS